MKVTIVIECDDEQDLFMHLSVIRQSLKNQSKKMENGFNGMRENEKISFDDSNCYGSHSVIMEEK